MNSTYTFDEETQFLKGKNSVCLKQGSIYHVVTTTKVIPSLPLYSVLGTPPRWLVFKIPEKESTPDDLHGDKMMTRIDQIVDIIETTETFVT